ncbi:MAG: hypothetical protein IT434_10290 [Phycisphaerales bacterium]|jgi:hypothetical protein|nr:hypothetical protein [Phycisphaerales bacterium]
MRSEPWRAGPAACVLAGVVTISAATPAFGQEVDLRPKFEQGQVVRYKLEQNSTSKTSADRDRTKNTSSQMDQAIWIAMRTMQVDESGVATVEVSYERVSLAIDSDEFKGAFDTAQPPASSTPPTPSPAAKPPTARPPGTPSRPATPPARNPDDRDNAEMLALVVRPMLDSKLTLKIDAAGNIISATGGAGLSPSSLVGLDGLKSLPSSSNAGLLGPIFTAKKSSGRARIGESWTSNDTLDASALGSMKMRTTHTLRSAAAGIASVDLAGMIDKSSEGKSGPLQVKDSTFAGRYKWDTAKGQLESMDINQSIAMEIAIEGLMLSSSHKARTRLTRLPNDSPETSPAPQTTPAPAPTKPRR